MFDYLYLPPENLLKVGVVRLRDMLRFICSGKIPGTHAITSADFAAAEPGISAVVVWLKDHFGTDEEIRSAVAKYGQAGLPRTAPAFVVPPREALAAVIHDAHEIHRQKTLKAGESPPVLWEKAPAERKETCLVMADAMMKCFDVFQKPAPSSALAASTTFPASSFSST